MQGGTYFPETRRMLLFHALLIWTHFWPASTLLRGFWSRILVWRAIHVWALSQNQWRLRQLHILKYATQLSCTWWVSVQNRSPCSLMLLIPFQHNHCTFVTILFSPFAGLFFNLAMRIRALFTKSATTLGLVEQAFWRVSFFTEWVVASSFEVILAKPSRHSSTGTSASGDFGFSMFFFHPAAWKNSETDLMVWLFHAYSYRGGNCNCLL